MSPSRGVMMTQPVLHLFVCQNDRPEGGRPSCAARGSGDVLGALQRAVGGDPELWGRVAVTPCGCLGPCFEGPAMVVYPEGIWYGGGAGGGAAGGGGARGRRAAPGGRPGRAGGGGPRRAGR